MIIQWWMMAILHPRSLTSRPHISHAPTSALDSSTPDTSRRRVPVPSALRESDVRPSELFEDDPDHCGLFYKVDTFNRAPITYSSNSPKIMYCMCPALGSARLRFMAFLQTVFLIEDPNSLKISHIWKAFYSGLGVSSSLTLGYHPQSNGQMEQCKQELEAALRCVINNNPLSWS